MKHVFTIIAVTLLFSAHAQNTNYGTNSLISNTSGTNNSAFGANSLFSNTTGGFNTASGDQSLYSNTTGNYNMAIGASALLLNTTGDHNTASGLGALYSNTTGNYNTASGNYSLFYNTTGQFNTALGYQSLISNTTGDYNTAIGLVSLFSNTTGNYNTATGDYSLYYNTTGDNNTASGYLSLYDNTEGASNTASGFFSLFSNTTGNNNTALGYNTLASSANAINQTVIGYEATGVADNSVVLGNDDVTAVYMGEDSGAAVYAAAFVGDGSQLTNLPNQNTDDQAISYDDVTNIVTVEDGGTIDLGLLNNSGTDDQALTLNVNSLDLEDGGSVDLSGYLDNTDNQNISGSGFAANILTVGIEGGTSEAIDLSSLDNSGTDDQALTLNVNSLDLEDGGSVDLSGYLDNTDDQNISGSGFAANILTVGIEGGTPEAIDLSSLDDSGTDDQALTLNVNSLDLENGGSVNLSGYLDNTDDQILGNFILSTGSILSMAIQDGNVVSVNLAPLLDDLEAENAAQQNQIDAILAVNNAQQALIGDLITRMEIREECECVGTLGLGDFNLPTDGPRLLQNLPNPFDNSTSIGYFIPLIYSKANIVISTSLGQILNNISITRFGEGSIVFNKAGLAQAIYYYTLYVDGKQIDTKRMVVE